MNERPTVYVVAIGPRTRRAALCYFWHAVEENTDDEPLWLRALLRFLAVWSWLRFCWFVRGLPQRSKP